MHIFIDLVTLLIIFPLISTGSQHGGQYTGAAAEAAAGGSCPRYRAIQHTNTHKLLKQMCRHKEGMLQIHSLATLVGPACYYWVGPFCLQNCLNS